VTRWLAAIALLSACASAPVNVIVKAEPWLQHESQMLQHSVSRFARSSVPMTVTIQLEPAVLDVEHASLVATCVVTDASGRTIGTDIVRVRRDAFDEAARAIAAHIAQMH
jgi:hypothetical protein